MSSSAWRPIAPPRTPPDGSPADVVEIDDDTELVDRTIGSIELSGTTPADVDLRGCRLVGSRLTGVQFERLRLTDVHLVDCELSGAGLTGAVLEQVRFERCRASGLVADGLRGRNVSFIECRLDGAWLRAGRYTRCEWVDVDLTGADLYGAHLEVCRILRSTLLGTELSTVEMRDVVLHGSDLSEVRGAAALRGATIGRAQIVALAPILLAATGIEVDGDHPAAT